MLLSYSLPNSTIEPSGVALDLSAVLPVDDDRSALAPVLRAMTDDGGSSDSFVVRGDGHAIRADRLNLEAFSVDHELLIGEGDRDVALTDGRAPPLLTNKDGELVGIRTQF